MTAAQTAHDIDVRFTERVPLSGAIAARSSLPEPSLALETDHVMIVNSTGLDEPLLGLMSFNILVPAAVPSRDPEIRDHWCHHRRQGRHHHVDRGELCRPGWIRSC